MFLRIFLDDTVDNLVYMTIVNHVPEESLLLLIQSTVRFGR